MYLPKSTSFVPTGTDLAVKLLNKCHIFFTEIDNSISICRLLLYSLSVLILVPMSLPEERPLFEEPLSPIGRVQSGLAALFLFESGNNVQTNLPNNNINKGRWTEEEHKILCRNKKSMAIIAC
jgi:hypothetical protein